MNTAIKLAAVTKLRRTGYEIESETQIFAICRDIARAIGAKRKQGQGMVDYINAYLAMPDVTPEPDTFIPQKATSPDWGKRPEYKPPVHFRDHEINAMPRPIAMSGVGNGGTSGMGRGR